MKHVKRLKKKRIYFKLFFVLLLIFVIFWITPTIVIEKTNSEIVKRAGIAIDSKEGNYYNILDLVKVLQVDKKYIIDTNIEGNITFTNNVELTTKINDFSNEFNYNIQVYINQKEILNKKLIRESEVIPITLEHEGKENLEIIITKNGEEDYKEEKVIYYIKPYEKQFLDEYSQIGICTHFGLNNSKKDNLEKSIDFLKALGTKWIRDSIRLDVVQKNNEFDFTETDQWINAMENNDINILGILAGGTKKQLGDDSQISNDDELKQFKIYANEVYNRYDFIKKYEILNEPNKYIITDEQKIWYAKTINELSNNNIEILAGASVVPYKKEQESIEWIKDISNYKSTYENIYAYSYHPYASVSDLEEINNNYKKGVNDLGGFTNLYITEYGKKTSDDNDCSEVIIQQNVVNQSNGIDISIVYQLRTNNEESNYDYGLLNNDYTPKPAYYAMKNYYENTNGAEYIGMVNLAEGLEAYVYDKDGKPKIIAWSDNSDSIISIDYLGFTAKDIYGNDIENTNGKLDITSSPVYLDNVSNEYYYKAISNTALEKYTEFGEKFVTEIGSVSGLQEQMDILKQYMGSISNVSSVDENIAKEEMQKHFHLGNLILEAYKNGNLNVEYVKLSSMLDMLNDIGDSYEDLVTVSSITKKPDIQGTKSLIDSTQQEINLNSDIEIVYPTKILEFSKELYEKSDYINNLEEENDIKTGLIVSYDLHAKYLADWANTFTNIYIDDYIENNPITESYSETNLTNKDVIATLNIGKDAKVTNNEGKNTYTFVNNGKFTFEYERRGRTFSKEVIVENIDKTLPVVSGVENGRTYSKTLKPEITDEHLEEVELKLNGQVVEGFTSGNEIKEEGVYELIAKDEANNETRVGFEIKYKLEPESEEYSIDGQYILGVRNNTTLEKFIEILNGNVVYTIYRNDVVLQKEDIVATGDTLVTEYGKTFYIIVKGDITKDGITNIKDLVQIRRKILGLEKFDELQLKAADMFSDEVINIKDLVRIRRIILGIE